MTNILDTLINPDKQLQAQYSFERDYQRSIIAMLLIDRTFLVESIDLIRSAYFTDDYHQSICKSLFDYFNEYKTAPTLIELKQAVRDRYKGDEVKIARCKAELDALLDYYVPGIDARPALQNRILKFAKTEAIRLAFKKTLDILRKNNESDEVWAEVYEYYKSAITVDRDFSVGLDYFQQIDERLARQQENQQNQDHFSLGFETLDNSIVGGGATRGEIWAVMSLPGVGKSLVLVSSAIRNVATGKKVLYITCEMNEDKVAQRFDSQLANINISQILQSNTEISSRIRDWASDMEDKQRLIIKQFPAGTADVNTIRAHHQKLKMMGFCPDMVIVDYIGEMKDIPGLKTYESRYRIVRDLRGFATEENFFCYTAMQPNRSARELTKNDPTNFIDDDNLGDSYAQTRPLDGLWSINQGKVEKQAGFARGFVAKSRSGRSRFEFYIQYNPLTLQMTEVSLDTYKNRMSLMKDTQEQRMHDTFDNTYRFEENKKSEDHTGADL